MLMLSLAAVLLFPASLIARAAADLVAVRREIRARRARREGGGPCRSN